LSDSTDSRPHSSPASHGAFSCAGCYTRGMQLLAVIVALGLAILLAKFVGLFAAIGGALLILTLVLAFGHRS